MTLVRGGARLEQATELWIVAPGADNPKPSGTISPRDTKPSAQVREKSTYLYDVNPIKYYSGDLEEFVLISVKQREQAEFENENAEVIAAGKDDVPESEAESAAREREIMTALGMESREAVRFRWADIGIARLLAKTKGANGIIIFYADDERYDIKKLQKFVEQGRDLLAEHGPLAKTRLSVEFGGYRESPDAEFWFIPQNGPAPVASPDERCKDESQGK